MYNMTWPLASKRDGFRRHTSQTQKEKLKEAEPTPPVVLGSLGLPVPRELTALWVKVYSLNV